MGGKDNGKNKSGIDGGQSPMEPMSVYINREWGVLGKILTPRTTLTKAAVAWDKSRTKNKSGIDGGEENP
jgi:hypothetical protein